MKRDDSLRRHTLYHFLYVTCIFYPEIYELVYVTSWEKKIEKNSILIRRSSLCLHRNWAYIFFLYSITFLSMWNLEFTWCQSWYFLNSKFFKLLWAFVPIFPSVMILSEVLTRANSVALKSTVPSLFNLMFIETSLLQATRWGHSLPNPRGGEILRRRVTTSTCFIFP